MSDEIPAPAAPIAAATENRPVAAHRQPPRYKPGQGKPDKQADPEPVIEDPVDTSSVVAVSADALAAPPALQTVFSRLLQELERLRQQLNQVQRHERWVEAQADHHPVLPVLHRHAFLRELGRVQEASRRAGGLPAWLIYLHLDGVEAVRNQQGLEAWDDVLRHAVRRLVEALRQTDILGYVDGGDFVVVLPITDPDPARIKAGELVRLLSQPFFWNGMQLHFTVGLGQAPVNDDLTPEQLLSKVDASRRGVLPPAS